MSDESLKIPIGADLAELQNAMSQISGHVVRMGTRINSQLAKSNAAFTQTSKAAEQIRAAFTRVWQSVRSGATAAFSGMVSASRRAAGAIRSAMGSVFSVVGKLYSKLKFALPIGGLLSFAGALGFTVKSINKAAQMESLETAFAPLLGGADAAKARIAELSKFAAATPFELPEIATGSRILETLTKGALATGAGLRMVGDVAAATQKPFDELATWIGRLYDGLQSGRPVGEAMARLQEMGVISGTVRARVDALQKSGAAGGDVWLEAAAALGKFSGSMERQSMSWNGKLSTLRDNINLMMAEFGKPIIDALKPFLDMAIARVEEMKVKAAEMGNSLKTGVNALMAAFQTGNLTKLITASFELAIINAVNKFAAGITGTMAFLSSSLGDIMAAIGKGLKGSGLMDIFKSLFDGIVNSIKSALYAMLSEMAGMLYMSGKQKHYSTQSQTLGETAGWNFEGAKWSLATLDLASGIDAMSEDLTSAIEKGRKAFEDSTAQPFIDPGFAKRKFDGVREAIQGQMDLNQKAAEDAARALDQKLKGSALPEGDGGGPLSNARSTLGTLTTSLGRVGGGGFGMTFFPMISEQRKGNSLLARIDRNTQRGTALAPAIA
jgi:hypothetical protein